MAKVNVTEAEMGGADSPSDAKPVGQVELGQKGGGNTVYVTSRESAPLVLDPGAKQVVIVQGMNVIPAEVWERSKRLAPVRERIDAGDLVEHSTLADATAKAKRLVSAGSPPLIPPSMVDRRVDLDGMTGELTNGRVSVGGL